MKKIITISREFGAGGGEIGRAVAQRLGFDYFDKAIILKACEEAGLDIASIVRYDEKVAMDFGYAQSLFGFYNRPVSDKLFDAQQRVIHKLAEHGNCVIVGRNANTILKEFNDCLHVFIHANPYWRLQRMHNKMPDTSISKISDQMRHIDKSRKKYCTRYTNSEFGVAEYYDICLSSSSLGIDRCVDVICDIAKS